MRTKGFYHTVALGSLGCASDMLPTLGHHPVLLETNSDAKNVGDHRPLMPTRSLVDVQEYHACVEEYRAELQAAMHMSPGLLDQMRARSVCYRACGLDLAVKSGSSWYHDSTLHHRPPASTWLWNLHRVIPLYDTAGHPATLHNT